MMYQVIDKRKQELDDILKGKHNVVTKIQAKARNKTLLFHNVLIALPQCTLVHCGRPMFYFEPSLTESGTTRVLLGEPTRNSCLRFFAVNPLSSNAPYFILLLCLTPDDFTRQGEISHSNGLNDFSILSDLKTPINKKQNMNV